MSEVLCEVDPSIVTLKEASYGENCKSFDPDDDFEENLHDYFRNQCYNSSENVWKRRCEFEFDAGTFEQPAPSFSCFNRHLFVQPK